MARFLAILALALAASPAAANTVGCGGNAHSRAEVVTRSAGTRSRGPIDSVPNSVCANLIEDRPTAIESLSVHIGDGPNRSDQTRPPDRNRAVAPRQP